MTATTATIRTDRASLVRFVRGFVADNPDAGFADVSAAVVIRLRDAGVFRNRIRPETDREHRADDIVFGIVRDAGYTDIDIIRHTGSVAELLSDGVRERETMTIRTDGWADGDDDGTGNDDVPGSDAYAAGRDDYRNGREWNGYRFGGTDANDYDNRVIRPNGIMTRHSITTRLPAERNMTRTMTAFAAVAERVFPDTGGNTEPVGLFAGTMTTTRTGRMMTRLTETLFRTNRVRTGRKHSATRLRTNGNSTMTIRRPPATGITNRPTG